MLGDDMTDFEIAVWNMQAAVQERAFATGRGNETDEEVEAEKQAILKVLSFNPSNVTGDLQEKEADQ